MGTTVDKFEAAFETKDLIKSGINRLGGSLTSESTFRSYATELENLYDEMPKVTGEGSSLSLTPTRKGGLTIIPKGACEQDSYSGKNLVGLIDGTYSSPSYNNEIVAVVKDGVITLNGTTTQTNFVPIVAYTNYSSISDGDSFTISLNNPVANTAVSLRTQINSAYDAICNSVDKVQTFAFREDRPFQSNVTIRVASGVTLTNFVLQPQIEEGSTATTYEKYVGGIPSPNPSFPQDIRVVTGDNSVNIFGKNLYEGTMELGSISGGDGTNGTNTNMVRTPDYIDLLNIRKIAIPNSNNSQQTIGLRFYNKDKQYLGSFSYTSLTIINLDTINVGNRTQYYTSNADIYYLRFVVTTSNDTTIKYAVMNNDTTYIAFQGIQTLPLHLGTEYLAGIGDYKDEIVGKTDEWKIKRYVGKVVLNGSETWNYASNNKNFYINGTNYLPSNQGGKCYTTHFIGNAIDPNYNQNLHSFIGNTSFITIKYFLYTNVNDLKNWLTTHNVTTYYILNEPVEIPITDTTLITDLNNMYQAMGYDGTTNISISSDSGNAQMTAEVKALKSLE